MHSAPEQTVFNLGENGPVVKHPVPLSAAELTALAGDDLMKQDMDDNPPITKLTGEGLEASVVHLHDSSERDLVVIGSGRPFLGANVGPYWVIRDLPSGPQVAFRAIALQIVVKKTQSHGFRDLEAFAATAVTFSTVRYRFDGTQYRMTRSKQEPIHGE
jgi:hypothetical protein